MAKKVGCHQGWEKIGNLCVHPALLDRDLPAQSLFEAIDLLSRGLIEGKIDVNDGDIGDGNREYKVAPHNTKMKRGIAYAHLVLEEDDSVHFYFNPERSDTELVDIPVQLDERSRRELDPTPVEMETDIINSPFTEALKWKKNGKITKTGREIIKDCNR